MRKLDNRVAVISGGGRGIGRATAVMLAADGAAVVVNDLDVGPATETVAEIEAAGGRAVACVGDVTSPDFGDRLVRAALNSFDGLDIIVNNAGYTLDGVIHKQSDEQFQAMLDVHVLAPFRILRAAAEPIRRFHSDEAAAGVRRVRKVVNISSISGICGNAGQVNYSSAKAALVGMTKTLAKEWGRYGVCVNCVAFGLIDTRLTRPGGPDEAAGAAGGDPRRGLSREAREQLTAMIPLGRAGTVAEAAGSIYLMCIPESDYVSGQVLLAAGGLGL